MDIYLTSNEIRTSQLDVYLGNLDIQHICPTITLNLEEHIKKEIKEEVLEEDSNSSSLVLEHSSDDDMKVHFCCHFFISTPPHHHLSNFYTHSRSCCLTFNYSNMKLTAYISGRTGQEQVKACSTRSPLGSPLHPNPTLHWHATLPLDPHQVCHSSSLFFLLHGAQED